MINLFDNEPYLVRVTLGPHFRIEYSFLFPNIEVNNSITLSENNGMRDHSQKRN